MSNRWRSAMWILFFGSLWGASEVFLNEGLRAIDAPWTSVPLTVSALLILGLAATRLPAFGTLILVALVAGGYRTATAGPFWCHTLALLALGFVLDAVRTALAPDARHPLRTALLGGLSAFAAHVAFAVLITYEFAYHHWTGDGGAKFREYVFVSGTIAAVLSAGLLPLALSIQARARDTSTPGPHGPLQSLPAATAALLWVVGLLV